jgi:hypothetical protein
VPDAAPGTAKAANAGADSSARSEPAPGDAST